MSPQRDSFVVLQLTPGAFYVAPSDCIHTRMPETWGTTSNPLRAKRLSAEGQTPLLSKARRDFPNAELLEIRASFTVHPV